MKTDVLLTRPLPQSLESERAILGAILLDNAVCNEAIELLGRADFYLNSHKMIFDKMVDLSRKSAPIDLVTLSGELHTAGEFEQAGGASYIASLIDAVSQTDSISYYAKLVKQKATLRRLVAFGHSVVDLVMNEREEYEDTLREVEESLFEITQTDMSHPYEHIQPIAQRYSDRVEQIQARGLTITGVPTGLTDIDAMLCGLQNTDLILLAARTSMGKTSAFIQVALNAAGLGFNTALFSLEMSKDQIGARVTANLGRVDAHRLRSGYLNREEWGRITETIGRLADYGLYVDDTAAISTNQLHSKVLRMIAEHDIKLIGVDYLGLMKGSSKRQNREQEVGEIARDLKAIAKEVNLPVVALHQISRQGVDTKDKRPSLTGLRDSGQLEEHCDVALLLHREEYYNETEENRGLAELHVAKQRNGPTGTARCAFMKEFMRFENLWRETEPRPFRDYHDTDRKEF